MAQDIQLKEFWEKVKRRRRLSEELSGLRNEQTALDRRVKELETKKQKEQKDAERLEKAGVRSFFYALIGKKEEKLEKERMEANAALEEYEEAFLKLESLNRRIELAETEWKTLDAYEEKFSKLLEGKRKLLSGSEIPAEKEILQVERKLSALKIREKAVLELLEQSETILTQTEQLQNTLIHAEQAETMRRFMGTEQLDKAQKQTAVLQKNLREFEIGIKTIFEEEEIADNLNVIYQFCNGIYTNYIASNSVMQVALLERIRTARGNARLLGEQLQGLTERLLSKQKEIVYEKRLLEEKREKLIIDI